jgi:hypothetical protein
MSHRFGRPAASSTPPRALGSLLLLRMVPHRSEGPLSNTLHIYPPPLDVVLIADCGDIDPRTPCIYEWLSKGLNGTLCTPNAMRLNHTEIRCQS